MTKNTKQEKAKQQVMDHARQLTSNPSVLKAFEMMLDAMKTDPLEENFSSALQFANDLSDDDKHEIERVMKAWKSA